MNKNNDYEIYLAIIAIWVMIGGLAQCDSARNLDDIRRELSGIKNEISVLKWSIEELDD